MKKIFIICCLFAAAALGESGVRNPVTRASLGAVAQDNGTATNLTVFNSLVITNTGAVVPSLSFSQIGPFITETSIACVFPVDLGLGFNTPFGYIFNSDYSSGTGWNSVQLSIANQGIGSFLVTLSGSSEDDGPKFAIFNDWAYEQGTGGSSYPIEISLNSGNVLIGAGLHLSLEKLPTSRASALVGGIYVDGTNEVLRIRLD